jgi:hypothetical protein
MNPGDPDYLPPDPAPLTPYAELAANLYMASHMMTAAESDEAPDHPNQTAVLAAADVAQMLESVADALGQIAAREAADSTRRYAAYQN